MTTACAGWIFLMIINGNPTTAGPFQTQNVCQRAQEDVSGAVKAALEGYEIAPFAYVGQCMPGDGKACR